MSKKLLILLILFLDSSLFYSQLTASTIGKEVNGYSVGISYGKTSQLSDIPASGGWGIDLMVGKTLYYDVDAMFSFDLLGNLDYLVSKGLDTDAKVAPFENSVLKKSNYKFFFNNNKTSLFGIGLDGRLTLNKYREEQNWYASLYAGGILGIYSVRMDMEDANGNNYSSAFGKIINDSKSDKKRQLKEILDGKYETKAEGFNTTGLKTGIMPAIGMEFGYDITDFISLYVRDKLYFSGTNKIDGEVHLDESNDLLNFASVGFNYYFHKAESRPTTRPRRKTMTDPVNGYELPEEVLDEKFPEVKIILPAKRPFNSPTAQILIKAQIKNVNNIDDIYCKVNDRKVNFDYNDSYVQFVATLEPGDNKIQIYAKNEYGQSRDVISIYHQGGREEVSEPEIKLMNPVESVFYSEEEVFEIKAIVDFVKNKKHIKILANGHPFKSYHFDPDTKEFRIKVRLAEGINSFEIIAENEEGKAINNFDIYYKTKPPKDTVKSSTGKSAGLPTIVVISPKSSNANIDNTDLLNYEAKVTNVRSKSDITFTVNGKRNKYYDFDSNTGVIKDRISIFDDVTKIKLVVKNDFGSAMKETTVYIGKEPNDSDQEENIIEFLEVTKPDVDCKVDISVKIEGAKRKHNLHLFLNQFEVRNFSFSKSTRTLKSTLYLDEGSNKIKVVFDKDGTEKENVYSIKCGLGDNSENGDDGEGNIDLPIEHKPEINIEYPVEGKTIEEKNIVFRSKVKYVDNKEGIRLSINGNPIYSFDFDPETGDLSAQIELDEGESKIELSATNTFGNVSVLIGITYEKPLAGPASVLINSPRNGFKTDENTAVFRATVENVDNMDDIYVTLNGEDFRDFQLDKVRSIIYGHLPLRLGKNTLRVEADNRLGEDSDDVKFYFRSEVLPAIKITSPKRGVVMGVAYAPLEAIVQNVKSKTGAIIYVNSKKYTSLKISDELLTSKVPLKNGENEIIVKIANEYGSASDTTMVLFNGKPKKPEISILKPAKSGKTVKSSAYAFEARVEGIKHSSFVDLTVNNVKVNNIDYFKSSKLIKAQIKLRKGWNYIKINARNNSGSVKANTKIFLK